MRYSWHTFKMQKLSFSNCQINDTFLLKFNYLFNEKNFQVSDLDLSHNKISSASFMKFCEFVQGNSNLLSINVSNNPFTDSKLFAAALFYLLKTNCNLQHLFVSNCMINLAGFRSIAEGLKINGSLMSLDLSDNRILEQGA